MKKLFAVALILCLLIPCAVAEGDWYYPFGFSNNTTYEDAVARILSMYETPEERIGINEEKGQTIIFPIGYTLFDIKLDGLLIQKNKTDDKYEFVMVILKDRVNFDGAMRFLDVVDFAMKNSKTSLLNIEPHHVSYDINGDPVVKTFLDDLYKYADDFENTNISLDYKLAWKDIFIHLEKAGNEYQVSLMFFPEDYHK